MNANVSLRSPDPAEILGAGVQVLKRLATPGSQLERREKFYALTGTGRAGRALHVPVAIVDALQRRDWLAPSGEGKLRLSDAGLGWLKRTLAGDDPFREQHQMRMHVEMPGETAEADNVVTVDANESPLTRLCATETKSGAPLIDDKQFLAGERLRRDFTLANLMPRLTADLEAPAVAGRRGAGGSEITDIALAARQRFSRALEALGSDLSGVAVDVCCHLKPLDAAESTANWPGSAALVVLKLALDRLAHHYGFHARGRTRLRAWQASEEPERAEAKK